MFTTFLAGYVRLSVCVSRHHSGTEGVTRLPNRVVWLKCFKEMNSQIELEAKQWQREDGGEQTREEREERIGQEKINKPRDRIGKKRDNKRNDNRREKTEERVKRGEERTLASLLFLHFFFRVAHTLQLLTLRGNWSCTSRSAPDPGADADITMKLNHR